MPPQTVKRLPRSAYRNGDYATALRLLRPFADRGDAAAHFVLGSFYAVGQGVRKDDVQAHKWYNLAASLYDVSEKANYDKASANLNVLAKRMTPAQIAEAQKLAREWKPTPEPER